MVCILITKRPFVNIQIAQNVVSLHRADQKFAQVVIIVDHLNLRA